METKRNINRSHANSNGIVFNSEVFPELCSETYRDDSGKIQTMIIPSVIKEWINMQNKKTRINRNMIRLLDIGLVILSILFGNIEQVIGAILFSIVISFDLCTFIELVYDIKAGSEKQKITGKYHAAEHMAVNAYKKLQRVPKLDEIKKFSRFSKDCSSNRVLYNIIFNTIICLLISFVAQRNIILYIILGIITITLMPLINAKGWLKYLQITVTNIPSDSELEVAIEGIKNFERMEERLRGEKSIISEIIHKCFESN